MNVPQTIALPRWKRLLDCTLILISFPFLVPLVLLIVFIIKRKSPGPVLFQQKRLGFQQQPFMCLKFRSMHCGAETVSHQGHLQQLITSDAPMTKLDNSGDSRIIPFGKILRSSGLDELPQLINVLKGEMSLVGPRPCVPYEAEKYLAWQKERFNAAPGLTGLWQVSGKNRTTFTRMMELDIDYTRKKTFWLDLKIIFMTVPALLVQIWDSRQKKKAQNCAVPPPAVMTVRVTHN
ncbi:MAG TPA: sugar transferase [Verrucomicrobiae bacterium]|nr:sugar transferase [Verrucomicrobiae bacterium]